jgi:hypothetical protein
MTHMNTQTGEDDALELAVAEELVLLRSKADLDAYYASTIEPAVPNSQKQAEVIFKYLTDNLNKYFDIKDYREDPQYLRLAVMRCYHDLLSKRYDPKLVELMFAGMGFELRHEPGKQSVTAIHHSESNTDVPVIVESTEAMSAFYKDHIDPVAPKSFHHVMELWSRFGNQPHNLQKYQVANPTAHTLYQSDLFNDVARAYYDNVGRYGKLADLVLKAMGFELGFEAGGSAIRTMRHTLSGRIFEYLRDQNIVREVQPAEVVGGAKNQVRDRLSGLLDPNDKV